MNSPGTVVTSQELDEREYDLMQRDDSTCLHRVLDAEARHLRMYKAGNETLTHMKKVFAAPLRGNQYFGYLDKRIALRRAIRLIESVRYRLDDDTVLIVERLAEKYDETPATVIADAISEFVAETPWEDRDICIVA